MMHFLIFASFIITALSQASTLSNSGKYYSSNLTLVPNVNYQFNFTMTKTIPSGSLVVLTFGSQYRIPNTSLTECKASKSSSVVPTAAACYSDYSSGLDVYSIVFTDIYTVGGAQNFLWLKYTTNNPYIQISSRIDVYIKASISATTSTESTSFFVDIIASPLSSCSYVSTTQFTGDNVSQIVKFTPSRDLIFGSSLYITMPNWFVGTISNLSSTTASTIACLGLQNSDLSSLSCDLSNKSNTEQLVTIRDFVGSNKSATGQIILQIDTLRNPWSTQSFGQIIFQLYYVGSPSQRCREIYQNVAQANQFKSCNFNVTALQIGTQNNNVQMSITIKNPCPKNKTRLRIDYSNQISITWGGTNTITLLTQNSTQMIFTNAAAISDRQPNTQISMTGFVVTTPQSTRPFSFKFTTQYIPTAGSIYQIETFTRTYVNNAGAITSGSVLVTNNTINIVTQYQITFKLTNKIVNTNNNGFIQIIFPPTLTIDPTATCNDNIVNTSNCGITSANITLSVNGSINAGTTFTVTIDKVKNAGQSIPSGSFKIYSYWDNQYDSLIDKVQTGITVTMAANQILTASVTPTNLTTYAITSYKFDFVLRDSITQGGSIQLQFPSQVLPTGSVALVSASFSTSTCSLSPNGQIIKLLNCFLSGPMTTLSTSITLSGIRNPPSYKITSSFQIRTFSSLPSLTNTISSGVTTQMNAAYVLSTFSITPLSPIVHADTKQTIDIAHVIPLTVNDYVLINFDVTMMVASSLLCQGLIGITSNGVTCLRMSNTQIKVVYASGISSQTLKYDITSVMNYDVAQTVVNFDITVYAGDNNIKEKATCTFTYTQATISTPSVNFDDKIILYDYSTITITLSTPFSLGSLFDTTKTMLEVTLPTGIVTAANTSCSVSVGSCTIPVNTKVQITSIGLGLSSFTLILTNILLPFISIQSSSFIIIFYYNGKKVSSVSTGVVIKPYCASPCKACSVTQIKCLSCLPAPNLLINYDPSAFSCVLNCPSGTYADVSKICTNCNNPCLTCLDDSKCDSCVPDTWLFHPTQTCEANCPDTYYNGANGNCIACSGSCDKCKSATQCLSCKIGQGYYYNFTCLPANSCPSGTYANLTTLNCQNCQTPCSSCQSTQLNCTSCISPYFYYDNFCDNSCPNGMYQSGNLCFNCTGLCNTCANTSYCLSCKTDYYYNGSCILASNCPIGTFPDSTLMQCKTCPSGCITCQNLSNCTSCDTTFYIFYQYKCITQCPDGTYKSGFTCQNCNNPCQNCQNSSTTCLSCSLGTYLYNKGCPDSCPKGFYEDINVCKQCQSSCADCTNGGSCTECSGSLYLTSTFQCLSQCPSGFYANILNNKCQSCTSPCSQCQAQPANCTSCIGSRVLYQNDCSSSSCPSQYFNVSGVCKTCSYCTNCLSADRCDSCIAGYFLFAGICYSKCPATAPIQDLINQACTLCDANCQGCSITAKNCTSCNPGQYLFNYGCFDSCPSGYVQSIYDRTCIPKQISSIFFFPTIFGTLALFIVLLYAKWSYRETQFVTSLTAITSIFCFISWVIFFVVMNFFQFTLEKQMSNLIAIITIVVVALSLVVGISYQIYLRYAYQCDSGYICWKQHDELNSRIYKVIIGGSIFSFIFYRFLYSRLFHRQYFSLCYSNGDQVLTHTHRISLFTIFVQLFPMVGVSFYTIYKKQLYDQTVYSALDTLIINVILIILLLIEGSKNGDQFFGQMRKKLPFIVQQTKGKQYLQIDSSMSIIDLDDYQIQKQKRIKTQVALKQRQSYFRRINCIQNLNKFGHLNEVTPMKQQVTKSLPQWKQLRKYPQYDPNQQDQINVIDNLFFEQDQQQKQRLQQERQKLLQEQQRKKAQQQQFRKKQQQKLRIQKAKRQQQQRLQQQRLSKLLQDQLQQQNLQCVDLAAIDKAQNKNKQKKSPLDFLSKCKTVDDKPVDDKAIKKLQDIAKKNGIDPQFMKQTFGIQKHHNQQLLNAIIDKHHHVNRQAVKQMFKQTNNKEVLQQLFSKNSTVDTQKLKSLMNDKDGIKMIQKLMDQQKGIVSAQIAKTLLDKNSKFKPQFTKKLLSGQTGADQKKLQQILRDAQNQKARQQNLKALKKIGGQNLQNTQLIQNMLGQQSKLDPNQFSKVAMNLSAKALQSIFTNKNPQNLNVIDKVLNNKKLNLRSLSPIFQDDQLIYQLGKKLGSDNPILEENIMNLLKNCGQNTDPQKIKEFLQNQVLVKKLMQNSVIDPQFLTQIFSKDSKANFDLIQKTLTDMPPEEIQRIFEFTGDKNIDYKAMSKIFEQNQKTDPQLVKKMLDPELVQEVFAKNNNVNANMLQKLVQKGSKFDKENIVSIYGKNTNNMFGNGDGNFDKQGRMTNRMKNAQIAKSDSLIQSIKNGPFSELIKNQSFSQMIKDGSLAQMIKTGSTTQILKNQNIQKMMKDGSFGQIMKNASNGQLIKSGNNGEMVKFGSNGQITKIGPKGQSISVDSNGDTIIIGSNGQTMKITKNGKVTIIGSNGQIIRNGFYQQLMKDGIIQQMINDGTFGQITKNGLIGQMIKNGTFADVIKKGNLAQIIQQQTYKEIIQNGAFTEVMKKGSLGQIILNQNIQQSIKNGTFQDAIKNGTFGSMKYAGTSFYNPQNNQTQYDFKMNFNKTANQNFNLSQNGQIRPQQMQQMIMSRTDGGIMGFLNPLKLKQKKKKLKASMKQKDQWDDLGQRLQNLQQDEDDQDQQYGNDRAILQQQDQQGFGQNRRKKPGIKKRKLKKITDIRHPAQKIYLQPILAPHQIQQNKNFRKKKKRDHNQSATKLIMDEDNDVFDIDF